MFELVENIIRKQGYTGVSSNHKTSMTFECVYDRCPKTVKLMVSKTKMTLTSVYNKQLIKEVSLKNQNVSWNFILKSFPKMEVL